VSVIALAYNVPLNYFVGLPVVAEISLVSFVLISVSYYLSRIKAKTSIAVYIFCITGTSLFTANFFLNEGIYGPTDLFFVLMMIIMVAVVPVKQYWFWVSSNIATIFILHYLQYRYPYVVPHTYRNTRDQFIDISSAYLTVVSVALIGFYLIRRSYEQERRSAEHKANLLQVLNMEKNKLFSIISHDLRAPLSNINNYLGLLTEAELTQDERSNIEIELFQSTNSTLDLLQNILSWSKSQMNGITISLVPLNVYDVLAPQLLLFLNIAKTKHITVEISIDPTLHVMGNIDALQLVVRNLINNAIKFTADRGNITITGENINDTCTITVKDSGVGKPVQLSSNIFNLNAVPTYGTNNEKGVGLGLVLCKEFIEAQFGKIAFECHKHSGTSFSIFLPALSLSSKEIEINC
jgi:two-component system sensor histidine kinase/response regulator